MANKGDLDPVIAIERLLEREDDEHLRDVFLDELDAVFFPGPELRAYEEDDRDAETVELFGELEVNVRKIDEDCDIRPVTAYGGLEAAEFAIDTGKVADDFRDAHYGDIFRSDDAGESSPDHARTAHADKRGVTTGQGELVAQLVDEKRAVVLAAGFSGGDEDGRVGHFVLLPWSALFDFNDIRQNPATRGRQTENEGTRDE